MAVNDTYELRVQGTAGGQEHIHTLHMRQSAAAVGSAELITQWTTGCHLAYRNLFGISDPVTTLLAGQAVCGTQPLPAPVEVVPAVGVQNGTRTGDANRSPAFIAGLVAVRTAFAGRSRRGRFFLGGLRDEDYNLDNMSSTWIALAVAYADAVTAAFITAVGANFYLVVHSRTLADIVGTACQDSSTLATSLVVSPFTTTMRSRKKGHGV